MSNNQETIKQKETATLDDKLKRKEIKLNLGCGNQTPPEWINVDYSLGAQIFKTPLFSIVNSKFKIFNITWDENIFIHDLRKKFPWSDNSVDFIYSSHTLEHFSQNEGYHFLQECHRVLRKQGTIRIVVPNLQEIVAQYIEKNLAADDFINKLEVSYDRPQDKLWKRVLAPLISFPHKCMYDTEALSRIMSEIGFKCYGGKPLASKIPDIQNIEIPSRTEKAVIIEGQKI